MTRWLSVVWVLSVSFPSSLFAQTVVNHCVSISQGLLTSPDNKAWLTTEIPQHAAFVKTTYYARPMIAGQTSPWKSCPDEGLCGDTSAIFPKVVSGSDPLSGMKNWSAMVTPNYATGGGVGSYGDTWVRMVVEYTTDEAVCKSQQSFQFAANSNARGIIVLPVGKSPAFYRTFGVELAPGFVWQACGMTPNPAVLPQYCREPGGQMGGLAFILTVDEDEADQAVRIRHKCEDKSSTLRRGCRTVVEYIP